VVLVAILFGLFFAVGISTPFVLCRFHAPSARRVSPAYSGRRHRISELAENFNLMASDIEEYIEKLKEAAEGNRELFIGSIRMLAPRRRKGTRTREAIRGRVAKYSYDNRAGIEALPRGSTTS